jgi:hypothetical protein
MFETPPLLLTWPQFQDFPFAPGGGPAPSSPFQQDLLDYLGRKALPKTVSDICGNQRSKES